jgi:Zn-finger nucleic acid-binding protein
MEPGALTGTRAYVCRPKPNGGVLNWPSVSTASDYDCPKCSKKLRVEAAGGVEGVDLLVCVECWGLAIQAKSMEGVVPDEVRESIEEQGLKHEESRSCPVCPSTMVEISVPDQENIGRDVQIDICGDCATTWFDAGELEALRGIKPKVKEVRIEDSSEKIESVHPVESSALRPRVMGGAGLVLLGVILGTSGGGGFCFGLLGGVVALGGLIMLSSKSPEAGLSSGECAKCRGTASRLAWTCQRAGCDARICTKCRSAGSDPAEAYARVVGGLALTVVGGAAGVGLALALKTPEPLALGAAGFAVFGGDDEEEEGELLCKSCADERLELTAHWGSSRWLTEPSEGEKEMGALQFADSDARTERKEWTEKEKKTAAGGPWDVVDSFAEGVKDAESKSAQREEYLKSQTHCLHIDGKTVKRCRRMVYRKSGYCYVHQRE